MWSSSWAFQLRGDEGRPGRQGDGEIQLRTVGEKQDGAETSDEFGIFVETTVQPFAADWGALIWVPNFP